MTTRSLVLLAVLLPKLPLLLVLAMRMAVSYTESETEAAFRAFERAWNWPFRLGQT